MAKKNNCIKNNRPHGFLYMEVKKKQVKESIRLTELPHKPLCVVSEVLLRAGKTLRAQSSWNKILGNTLRLWEGYGERYNLCALIKLSKLCDFIGNTSLNTSVHISIVQRKV